MKGCADRQRKQQLLLGGSSHTGGWRVEEGEGGSSTLIYRGYKSRLVTTDIHHYRRQAGLGVLQLFLVLSVNQGGISGSFITILTELQQREDGMPGMLYFRTTIHSSFSALERKAVA